MKLGLGGLAPAAARRWAPWLRDATVGGAVALVVGMASYLPQWRLLELKGFDWLTVMTAPGATTLPITIVGIDEASFAELNRQWPWPRSWHARLIEKLNDAGAAVVAFDLVMSEPSQRLEDQALATAIAKAGNVVLAADLTFRETANTREWLRTDPLPAFTKAGAASGLATVTLDGDLVVRRFPVSAEAFWRAIVRTFDRRFPGILKPFEPGPQTLARYVGPDHTFPYVSYYQALEPEKYLPPDSLRDNIIIVGRDVKASPEPGMALADMMASPFLGATGFLTPGVELHATFVENAIRGAGVRELPRSVDLGLLALAVALATRLLRGWHPLRSSIITLILVGAAGVLGFSLFALMGWWLPVAASIAGIALVYLAHGAIAFLVERRQRNEIKRAFGHYVSPLIVEELANHPERLRLGGEKREVTVMFTDLAGFTTVSEALRPEDTARILTEHLTALTHIVHKYSGTVDKFIGDAIMAFWGAPLDDPRQAEHACRAGLEMQQEMARMRERWKSEGLPELHMRVGITRGAAIIGNMGADDRFDYTAIGDVVNLAARLEGVNKIYGTQILVTQAVAVHATALGFRPVDKVAVKGKSKAIELFTPCEDAELARLTLEAIHAYRARRWDESLACWRAILSRHPEDGVAQYYLGRIEELRTDAPPVEWEGELALDTK